MKKRRSFLILLLAALVAAIFYSRMGNPLLAKHLFTSISPDGRYKLEVYREWRLMAVPGDGGSQLAYAILRNRWGWKIGETNNDCAPFDYDVYPADKIEWDLARGEVGFAPARSISLHSGKCEM